MKQVEVVFALAHIQPATVEQISYFWGANRRETYERVRKTWENGYILRRRHPEPHGGGAVPHQYALADRSIADDTDDNDTHE